MQKLAQEQTTDPSSPMSWFQQKPTGNAPDRTEQETDGISQKHFPRPQQITVLAFSMQETVLTSATALDGLFFQKIHQTSTFAWHSLDKTCGLSRLL